MDEPETKSCPNCKREIPASNFTVHSVHCARNIKVCPVCKEPVPFADLQLHHEEMHKPQPCKKCGESVCGTDLEDHIRDSCSHTIQTCKFCELELPRRELPAHEGYCGARTEQCAECREWVMLRYRQLHLDSNHGFLRLDDDPDPKPKKEPVKTAKAPKVTNAATSPMFTGPSTSNGNASNGNSAHNAPTTGIPNGYRPPTPDEPFFTTAVVPPNPPKLKNINLVRDKRTNVNADRNERRSPFESWSPVEPPANVQWLMNVNQNQLPPQNRESSKKKSGSRGAIKKRAPPPPEPPPMATRDQPYYSAVKRQQDELRLRRMLNDERRSKGLPPLLTPAEKLEKLRKMDALHNSEEEVDYKDRLQGRVWGDPSTQLSPPEDLRNLTPMSPDQFIRRFSAIQLQSDSARNQGRVESRQEWIEPRQDNAEPRQEWIEPRQDNAEPRQEWIEPRQDNAEPRQDWVESRRNDRFNAIKSSLQELRRGLNEVTAPYNSNAASNDLPPRYEPNPRRARGAPPALAGPTWLHSPPSSDDEVEVRLPCEFCGRPQLIDNLVQHQTGCRPDLAQYRVSPARGPPSAARPPPPAPHPDPQELPVIPCEFCTESLPVYLITEHQERCSRENNEMY